MAVSRTRRVIAACSAVAALLLVAVPSWLTTQPVLTTPTPGPPVFPARLEAEVRELTREPRGSAAVARLDALAAHLGDELARAGAHVTVQAFTPSRSDATYRNVVARVGPPSEDTVVVGAHYDAREGEVAPDAATGVAALIELAGSLSKEKLGRGVELVAYTLGAPPYFGTVDMGSSHHARSLREQRRGVRAMVSLEGIGCFSRAPGTQRVPRPLGWLYPTRADFVAVVGRHADWRVVRTVKRAMGGATDLPVWSLSGTRRLGRVDAGDHQSYWAHGFRAAMITDTSAVGWRDPAHDVDSLDFRGAARVTSALHAAIVELAR